MNLPNSKDNYQKLFQTIHWNKQGLIPTIIQDWQSHKVLMLAWINKQALEQSIESKLATYYSRSKERLWVKGESSGHYQKIKSIQLDCDYDSALFKVEQIKNIACHTYRESCFFYQLDKNNQLEIILPIKK